MSYAIIRTGTSAEPWQASFPTLGSMKSVSDSVLTPTRGSHAQLEPHAADVPLGALVLEGLAAFEVGRNETASATAIGKAENNYREVNPDYEPMAACGISDWTAERPIWARSRLRGSDRHAIR